MDHIPRPSAPARSLPETRMYVSRDFVYPKDKCYHDYFQHALQGNITESNPGTHTVEISSLRMHCVFQELFYFGLLSHLTRESFPASRALSNKTLPSEEPLLSSSWLPGLIDEWVEKYGGAGAQDEKTENYVLHLHQNLVYADGMCERVHKEDADFDPGLLLSVQLLIHAIQVGISRLGYWGARVAKVESASTQWKVTLNVGWQLAKQQMEEGGWCSSMVHMFSETCSLVIMIGAIMIEAPGRDKDHSQCSEHTCVAHHVTDESTYVTRHTGPDCTCEFVFVDQRELSDILCARAGAVPVIEQKKPARRDEDGRLYLSLGRSLSSDGGPKPYVAISHVWSDGMGNPFDNSIPLCLFLRLCNQINALPQHEDLPFWLDTLCFPHEVGEAYDEALVQMRRTYEASHTTLVIDSYLLKLDATSASKEELAFRVLCSPWSRRLWTLQEGVLPRRLIFQFANGPINLGHGHCQNRDCFYHWGHNINVPSDNRNSSFLSVESATRRLAFRSTSNSNDEPLCLGNIMGLNADQLVGRKVVNDPTRTRIERMKFIWSSFKEHSLKILFDNGPKLEDDGFRWAPATLMGACGHTSSPYPPAVLEQGKGLRVTLSSLEIDCSDGILPSPRENGELTTSNLILDGHRYVLCWQPRFGLQSSQHQRKLVILLRPTAHTNNEGGLCYDHTWLWGIVGEIGQSITPEASPPCFIVRAIGKVGMSPIDKMTPHSFKDQVLPDKETLQRVGEDIWQKGISNIIRGKFIGEREWCVD